MPFAVDDIVIVHSTKSPLDGKEGYIRPWQYRNHESSDYGYYEIAVKMPDTPGHFVYMVHESNLRLRETANNMEEVW